MQTQFRLFKANQNTLSQILFFSLVVRANNLGFRVCYYFQVWEETFQSSLLVCLNHILRRTSRVWRFFWGGGFLQHIWMNVKAHQMKWLLMVECDSVVWDENMKSIPFIRTLFDEITFYGWVFWDGCMSSKCETKSTGWKVYEINVITRRSFYHIFKTAWTEKNIPTPIPPFPQRKQGLCHTVALPFTLKKYLKPSILSQKKNSGNSNISPCKNIIFKIL
jgi:hypothetical protein